MPAGKASSLWTAQLKRRILVRGQMLAAFRKAAEPKYHFWMYPTQKKRWTHKDDPPLQTNWGDLFFDLIYVGAAFSLGKMLKSDLSWVGFSSCAAMFLPLMQAWENKVTYCARLDNNDLVHKLVDYVESVLVAAAAVGIPAAPSLLSVDNNGRWFSICMLCLRVLAVGQWTEVLYAGHRCRKGTPEMRQTAKWEIISATLAIACFGTVIALAQNDNASRVLACVLWGLSVVLERGCMQGLAQAAIRAGRLCAHMPYHGHYMLHRFGEWTMLMLGESVLSLLVVRYDRNSVDPPCCSVSYHEYAIAFVCAFTTAMSLQFIHYTTQPMHPHSHAIEKSLLRGFWWSNFMFLYSLALLVVGVGGKVVITYMLQPTYGDGFAKPTHTMFMSGAAAACLCLAKMMEALHLGVEGAKAAYQRQQKWFVGRSALFFTGFLVLALLPLLKLRVVHNVAICTTCVTAQAIVCCFDLAELQVHAKRTGNALLSPTVADVGRKVAAAGIKVAGAARRASTMSMERTVVAHRSATKAVKVMLRSSPSVKVMPQMPMLRGTKKESRGNGDANGQNPKLPSSDEGPKTLPHCGTAPGRLIVRQGRRANADAAMIGGSAIYEAEQEMGDDEDGVAAVEVTDL